MNANHNHKSNRDSLAPLRRKLIAAVVAACYGGAYAAPVNPTVVAGQASFNLQGKTYSITNTPNAIINWQSFSINPGEITRFIQQSGDSKVLNRITGQDPSQILGALQSNGKVFLINPNGVMFGAGSRVDVNGLVASSLNISNADFLAGKNNFDGAANAGKVGNAGTITTPSGGQIFLVAPAVENSGVISSPNGEVVLAAGRSVQLFDSKDPNVQVVVSAPADQALNLGSIVAQGGRVGVYGALVNQRGTINANSAVRGANGQIVLKASGTTLVEAGSTTSAVGGNLNTGGDIMLLGAKVGVTGNAVVDASGAAGGGAVLVGGDYQGKNAAVMNARQSYVGQDSVIKADATVNGDGGKVVVWSDQATQVFGAISARGGAAGGNGGQVETSGHYLDMQGRVDTRAPRGATGKLLLDPSDVYIALDGSAASIAGMVGNVTLPSIGGLFLETTAVLDSLLTTGFLQTSLLSTDVTVSTQNASGTGGGAIHVVSPLLWTSAHALTLKADSGIQLKAAISGINAPLHLDAGGAITQTTSPIDALAVSSLSAIAAGGITLDNNANTIGNGATLQSAGGNVSLTAVNVNLGASSAAGTLTATAYNGDLTVGGNVGGAGGVTLSSNKAGGTVTINSGQTVSSSGGDIVLKADRMALNGAIGGQSQHEVRLQPYQDSVDVAVGGGAADGSGVLGLSEAELQHISVPVNGLLSIGLFTGSAAGALNVNGSLDLSSSLGGGGVLLQTQAGALNISSGATLSVPGVLSLQTLPSGDHRVSNAGSVTSGSGINIFAGKMTLAGGSLTASSVSLETGNQVDIGATGNPTGTLALTGADLASVHGNAYVSINGSHTGTGDIVVSAPQAVATNLSLTAQRNIDLQASLAGGGNLTLSTVGNISAGGGVAVDGAFELLHGSWTQNSGTLPAFSAGDFKLTGGSFVRAQGGDGTLQTPYLLTDVYGLQGAATLANYTAYKLAGDIDASPSAHWSASFRPIAQSGVFTGVFDGDHHGISGLTIHRPTEDNVGLFSLVDTGTIKDLILSGVDVTGNGNVGALAGNVSQGIGYISGISVDGHVSGATNVGGLVGNSGGLVTGSSSSGVVTGVTNINGANIGGLVGRNTGQINTSSSSADVHSTGNGYTGGLVGSNAVNGSDAGLVTHSFAAGSVYSSGEIIGGLVGDNNGGHITSSYAAGSVSGGRNVGGLAGRNTNGGVISDAYATGDVGGNMDDYSRPHANIGGLVGNLFDGSVSRVFSSGIVHPSGFSDVGGLVGGYNGGALTGGYFNLDTAGTNGDSAGGVALTSEQMKRQDSFTDFDFVSAPIWRIYDGHTTPMLKTFLTPYTVTVTGGGAVSKTYDGASAAFGGGAGALASGVNGALGYDGAVNVGTYNVGGLWSTQYDISYTGSNPQLTITPRAVSAIVSASKIYDGGTDLQGQASYSFSNLVGTDTLGITGQVSFSDKNAGGGKSLTVSDAYLYGNEHGNYTLSGISGTGTGTITQRPLSTWIGGSGLWSVAGNWQDGVAPDGANVLAASLGAGQNVITYDAASGDTTLAKLTSSGAGLTLAGGKLTLTGGGADASSVAGALTLNGGALDLSGKLHADHLVLSSGSLHGIGAGNVLEVAGLAQTGGVIDSDGAVSIGDGGNISVGNIRALSLALNAQSSGAITQTGQVVTDSLVANAYGGITLTGANNHVQAFEAHVAAGNIALNNTVTNGELALGPLSTTGNIVVDNHGGIHTTGDIVAHGAGAGTGLVSLAAHSPVTIDNGVDGSDIVLSASTGITLGSGAVLGSVGGATHSISLSAGTNIVLGGSLTVASGGSISAAAANGNITAGSGTQINSGGGTVSLSAPQGAVASQSIVFAGGTVPTINESAAAAAAKAAAGAAADAAAKAAADAAAKAAADSAAKAAADAAAKAAADAAAKAATDAAAKAATDAAAKAAADAVAKAAADAAAADAASKAAADAAAKAAADAAKAAADAKAASDAAADAAAKAAADAAAKAAADAAAKAAADAAAQNQQTQQNQPVAQAINSTLNIINSATGTGPSGSGRASEVPDSVAATTGSGGGNSKPDDKVPDEKVADGVAHAAAGAKEAVKKMYCN